MRQRYRAYSQLGKTSQLLRSSLAKSYLFGIDGKTNLCNMRVSGFTHFMNINPLVLAVHQCTAFLILISPSKSRCKMFCTSRPFAFGFLGMLSTIENVSSLS
jgi:hypothetical protein